MAVKNVRADLAPAALSDTQRTSLITDYVSLTKPRLNFLVVVTSAAGYYLGVTGSPDLLNMAQAVAGTALVAGGSAVLNQVYERDTDARMRRTRLRPLPDQRVSAPEAAIYGLVLSAAGLATLALTTNWLAAGLALATLAIYLVVYTPMKRTSNLSTLVGAVPGALPAVIGWAAARGDIAIGGWTLFAIVFLWQIPHFMAIAWMYRDDYRSAGFPMLPVIEPDGLRTGHQALLYAAALLPVSIGPSVFGLAGWVYFWLALVLGIVLLVLSARFARERSDRSARLLFFASIIYLPLIWAVMVLDH
ncbi:MAG: protoheme IX farnesyltransferase [Acidobacteria bacterium]|nr:protoheme IX farnesyltransferase [Acidobacteriota bacterium]